MALLLILKENEKSFLPVWVFGSLMSPRELVDFTVGVHEGLLKLALAFPPSLNNNERKRLL